MVRQPFLYLYIFVMSLNDEDHSKTGAVVCSRCYVSVPGTRFVARSVAWRVLPYFHFGYFGTTPKYGKSGLLIGAVVMISGILLGLYGVADSTSWSAKFVGFECSLIDASPGVVLFVIGLFVILFTRPKVNLQNLNG